MIGFLSLFPETVKVGLGFVLGAAVVGSMAYLVGSERGESIGRSRLVAEQAVKAQREEMERKGDDAKLQRMSDYDLCISYLGRVPECESLRVQPVSEK